MAKGSSEWVRRIAERDHISIGSKNGGRISIRIGEIERSLLSEGFPPRHLNQICSSLESEKFWKPRGLELLTPKGQPRRTDTVLEFSFRNLHIAAETEKPIPARDPLLELAGLLKGAIREGADAFVREIRRDKGLIG